MTVFCNLGCYDPCYIESALSKIPKSIFKFSPWTSLKGKPFVKNPPPPKKTWEHINVMFQLPPPPPTAVSTLSSSACFISTAPAPTWKAPLGNTRPFAVGEKYHQIFHAPENYQVISLNVGRYLFQKKSNLNQPSIFKGIFVSFQGFTF